MRRTFILSFCLTFTSFDGWCQTEQTQDFHNDHPEAFTLFFYKSTIRMLDPSNSDEYFNMIKEIERAKFLRFEDSEISETELQSYITAVKSASFEEGMTMRQAGGTANVFIRDAEGQKPGIIFIMKSEGKVFILDIVGKVQVSNLMELTNKINLFESFF